MSDIIYNEINPFAAQWLRNLCTNDLITPGEVDETDVRSLPVRRVRDARRFHAFAGIGVWDYALRLAGWPDDIPIWTGSCRASRSPQPESGKEPRTTATSGRPGSDSSGSAALQLSLESRLRVRLAGRGSDLYALTWKHWDIPSGPRICALRASAPRTSGSGCSSWPTPTAWDWRDGRASDATMARNARPLNETVVQLTGWQTPTCNDVKASDYSYSQGNHDKKFWKLPGEAKQAGWGTPTASEPGGTVEAFLARKIKAVEAGSSMGVSVTALNFQAEMVRPEGSGPQPTGSSAATASLAQLNPEHSRWLMGLPAEWLLACPSDRPRTRPTGTTDEAHSTESETPSSPR